MISPDETLKQQKKCKLCSQQVFAVMRSEEDSFCCIGCQTVYNILLTRNELSCVFEHPLFLRAVKSGVISNPALLEELKEKKAVLQENELEKIYFEINDLWCPSCAEIIRLVLMQEKGVKHCIVDYSTDLASLEYAPRFISKERILSIIKGLGYSAITFDSRRNKVGFDLYLRFFIAAFFSLNIMMLSYPVYASFFVADTSGAATVFAWISFFASLPVVFYSGYPILRRFLNTLAFGFSGMETLVVIGVFSSFGLSFYELLKGGRHIYFDSMSIIITLVLLGKIIESRAKFSTKEALFRLTKAIPKRGRKRFSDHKEKFVLLKEIQKGDCLVALQGEKIVLDGIVSEGQANVDESIMTGEAIPVRKKAGDKVLSGTVISQGSLSYLAQAKEEETTLHLIIGSIEKDIQKKSSYVRAVDPIVSKFVPIVFCIATISAIAALAGGGIWQEAVVRAVSVLLISCPCAIGIAAPIVESEILNGMAGLGAIVRNRGCLPLFGKEDLFLFDKTGTITEGRFRLVLGVEGISQKNLEVLKAITTNSTHPICLAMQKEISAKPEKLSFCKEIAGKGMQALFEDTLYFLGSKEYVKEQGVVVQQLLPNEENVATEVFFVKEKTLLKRFLLGDEIKKGAKEVLKKIKPTKTVLVSGDSEQVVKSTAALCGFDEWKAGISPLGKRDLIDQERKKGKIVCMMGDGINDAPALAGADIGISVVSATDLSIQVSDIMLTSDCLSLIPHIRALSTKGQKIIRQNLFWAFFYNFIGIGLAAFGFLSPLFSASAMVLSSLFVLFNARRAKG